MLAVDDTLRGKGIGTCLIVKSILSMRAEGCEEIVLETECSNAGALRLYENLGFFRDKRAPAPSAAARSAPRPRIRALVAEPCTGTILGWNGANLEESPPLLARRRLLRYYLNGGDAFRLKAGSLAPGQA